MQKCYELYISLYYCEKVHIFVEVKKTNEIFFVNNLPDFTVTVPVAGLIWNGSDPSLRRDSAA